MNSPGNFATKLDSKYSLTIAKWFNIKKSAISLRFDDNLDSHVNLVIPQLNSHDIKATFMINPGRNNFIISYKRHQDFWEKKVPKMGHRLGNHTWNHKGARNLKEAEYEIGEVSKLLWYLYPNENKLNVFASGGGETWGGRRWHKASFQYKYLVEKFFLLDLYSGEHKRVELNSNFSQIDWNLMIEDSIKNGNHLAFIFHKIGYKSLIDFLKEFLTGYNNCFYSNQFSLFLADLESKKDKIWIAPLIDILKYEREYKSSELQFISNNNFGFEYGLKVNTDSALYDHPLSLVYSVDNSEKHIKVFQNETKLEISRISQNHWSINVQPKTSKIFIRFT
jgi:hypothetical protein